MKKIKKARRLIAREGFRLTQSADVPLMERTFGRKIVLAINDDPANYKEIPLEEAEKIEQLQLIELRKQQEEMEREMGYIPPTVIED